MHPTIYMCICARGHCMWYVNLTFGDVKPYIITTVCMLKQWLLQNKPWLLYTSNLMWSLPCLTAFSAAYHISTTLHTTTYIWWLRVAGKIMFNNSLKTCIELSSINCTRHYMVNIVKKKREKRQHHHYSSHPSCHVYKQPFSAIVVIPSNISTGHPQNMIKPLDHSILIVIWSD